MSTSRKLIDQKNYCKTISNIYGILKLWQIKNLSIDGNIVVFKILTISKLVYFAPLAVIPNGFIDEIAKMQKAFTCNDSSPKIKHETLRIDFKAAGLENIGV